MAFVTPSHNPPADGGFKYNPPNGGPADTDVTGWIQRRANTLLLNGNREVKRVPFDSALKASTTRQRDFIGPNVQDLAAVIDMEAIRSAGCTSASIRSVAQPSAIGRRSGRVPPEYYCRQSGTQSDFSIYAGGSRRQDSNGLFQPLCHGRTGEEDDFDIAFGNDADADPTES